MLSQARAAMVALLGVSNRVLDVLVPEISLQRSGVVAQSAVRASAIRRGCGHSPSGLARLVGVDRPKCLFQKTPIDVL